MCLHFAAYIWRTASLYFGTTLPSHCRPYGENGGGGHWSVRMEWRRAGWSVCLPLLIFPRTMKSRSSLLVPAHPGGPGKRAVKRLWWWWCGPCLSKYATLCLSGLHIMWVVSSMQMHSLKEASAEYVTALEETEKKLSSCPAEVGMTRCLVHMM